jgi:hypothetical protein
MYAHVARDLESDIRLPAAVVSKTISYALSTRTPNDAFRMHSMMSEIFTGRVIAGDQKKIPSPSLSHQILCR